MVRPDIVRHQSLDGLADQVVAVIAEQRLGPVVDIPDHACPINPHQGIRHRFQQAHEIRLVLPVCQVSGRGLSSRLTRRRHLFSLRTETETRTLPLNYAAEDPPPDVSLVAMWGGSHGRPHFSPLPSSTEVIEPLSLGHRQRSLSLPVVQTQRLPFPTDSLDLARGIHGVALPTALHSECGDPEPEKQRISGCTLTFRMHPEMRWGDRPIGLIRTA